MPDADTAPTTIAAHLAARFPADAGRIAAMIAAGDIVTVDGTPLDATAPLGSASEIWLYRDPPPEHPVPFPLDILHRDEHLLVVDKPHFLATMPRGRHIIESALVRLRRSTGNDDLAPAHRLDRLTAGVLVFTAHPAARGRYQQLFASGAVRKVYETVSSAEPAVGLPTVLRSRIVKEPGSLQAREIPGEPNAVTEIAYAHPRHTEDGRVRLTIRPITGKTHQIRVHLASTGAPILHDPLYPTVLDGHTPAGEPAGAPDFSRPLQLLARSVEFTDPYTGAPRRFDSRRTLACW